MNEEEARETLKIMKENIDKKYLKTSLEYVLPKKSENSFLLKVRYRLNIFKSLLKVKNGAEK